MLRGGKSLTGRASRARSTKGNAVNDRLARLMISVALISTPMTAAAQALDFTPDPARILSDPNYLPLAGQIYGTTAYSHAWTDGNSANSAGLETSSFHINTNTIDQLLSVGITDDIAVNASIAYAPADFQQINYVNGRSGTLDSSGFSDPTFGATWRVLDQNAGPLDLDLLGSYSPDLIDAHTSAADAGGTVARGGDSGTVGAALGYDTRSFGIRGAFNANFLGNSNVYDLSNGDTLQTQGRTNYTVSLTPRRG